MANHINLKGNKLVVTFRFDPSIVAAIKRIDGRQWNKEAKHWEIPVENVSDALKVLEPLGFTPTLDVMNLMRQEKEFLAKIEDIRISDKHYTGTLPLFDFQRKGATFIKAMPCALLADVPGLGKSIQTIAGTEDDDQVLIFCPSSLKFNWNAEIAKWLPDAYTIVIEGDKKLRADQWGIARDGVYSGGVKRRPKYVIANYELLLHDKEILSAHEWDTIACDEATRISNPDSQTTKNLKLLRCKKRLALTGTPVSNKPDDVFSIIDWLVPRYLGSYAQFKEKYCVQEDDWGNGREYKRIIGYQNMDQLRDKIGRFMLRRTKEEVFTDFPPKTVENIIFDLSGAELKLYEAIKKQIVEEIEKLSDMDTRSLQIIPVKMLRLKQCTDHTALVDIEGEPRSSKLEALKDIIGPIVASGEKAIIFTQFSSMLHILEKELKEYRPLTIFGDVDNADRFKRVQEFNDDDAGRVIIMTEAGAYGLNMQSASYVIHYDLPWSVAKLQQREDRAHRIGRNKPVTVYNLIAKDTIDEYVFKILTKKNRVSVDILKDAERLEDAGLSEEDIKSILRI